MSEKRKIIIVGGGISGLALLHYLKIKHYFQDKIDITLLEKNDYAGGTIQTLEEEGCLFETGPNGFLNSKPRTLEFIKELGLESSMVRSAEEAKIRYLSVKNTLHAIPTNPKAFLFFKLLGPLQKLRVLGEFFMPRGKSVQETVDEFGRRRLGQRFTEIFLDPMVSGIYGGNVQDLVLSVAFPRIYALEQQYGSLFKAMRKLKKNNGNNGTERGMPKGTLTSFNQGMQTVIDMLYERYKHHIHCGQIVQTVSKKSNKYIVYSSNTQYEADELFMCTPAYATAPLLRGMDAVLTHNLQNIVYAPLAVVGVVLRKSLFKKSPKGFGYLIPSFEKKQVRGVLFDSNIFPHRCPSDHMLFRVMIGGARYPYILDKPQESLIQLAVHEIVRQFRLKGKVVPEKTFFKSWPKAIPQYDRAYVIAKKNIADKLQDFKNLHLVANYWNGISFNDCIENAYQNIQNLSQV